MPLKLSTFVFIAVSGLIFCFTSVTLAQYQILLPIEPQEKTNFGHAIAQSGDYLAVSNSRYNFEINSIGNGAVYIQF